MLKEYDELLEHDAGYYEKARTFTSKVKDVNEFLAALPLVPPKTGFKKRVTYQDSCHLVHAQRIKEAPRKLLSSIPGVEFAEMRNSDRCCGAAGRLQHRQPGSLHADSGQQDAGRDGSRR